MFTAVPTKTGSDVWTEDMFDTYVRDNLNRGVMRPLGGVVLGAAAPSVTLSNLSTTDYWLMLIILDVRGDAVVASTNWRMRFNGDSGANYYTSRTYARNTTVSDVASGPDTGLLGLNMPGASAPASVFGQSIVRLAGMPLSGFFRTAQWSSGSKSVNATNGAYVGMGVGRWTNTTAPLSTITFSPDSGNFAAGSKFHIYGVSDV